MALSVEERILEHICDECDCDPVKCYEQGYCEYEENENYNKEITKI